MQHATQQRPRVPAEGLDLDHYHPLTRALRNIMSTPLAHITYAQLIDGLPLVSTVCDMRGSLIRAGHPLLAHDKLCAGALNRAELFCREFDPAALLFDSLVIQRYQDAAAGSREFNMRLVELVVAALHQIAVFLFQSDDKLHIKEDIDAVVSWKKPPEWVVITPKHRFLQKYLDPHPTLFYHVDYLDYQQYPHGLADAAGYWAEDRIFGGIAVFDRGSTGTECNDIYFHSGRENTTFRVWRLLESQFKTLTDFLLSEQPSDAAAAAVVSPFPILPSDANRQRHDPWDAIALHHVYRDPWERHVPPTKPDDGRDVRSTGDYPELEDMFEAVQAAVDRADQEKARGDGKLRG